MKQTSHFKIGLDYRMAGHTGIGTYLRGLVSSFALEKNPAPTDLALFGAAQKIYGFSGLFFSDPIYSIREQWTYPQLVRLCDLWHAPHYNIPLFHGRAKLITTIHDLIHWVFRSDLSLAQRAYAGFMLRRAVDDSNHILTVSESSKRDLINFFDADPSKITVIPNGVSSDFAPMDINTLEERSLVLKAQYNLPDSFFLYVGMLKKHKNVSLLIRAYLELKKANKIRAGLVIIGRGDESAEDMRLIKDHRQYIKHIERLESNELPVFYNAARALIHPSLYEGFGLTVLEALSCGTPVITTRRASLPEVGGDAARYIDGEDQKELEIALLDWDQDSDLKEKYYDRCLKQACHFSWNHAARSTAAVYSKVLNA